MLEPDEIEDLVVAELGSSALFGARFRENAGRALLIPRARPGKRTPLWQQRLKSQSLLEVAKKYGEFPIILETYRECLRDVLDVPGLVELLTRLHRRELTLVEVETATASPFASSLLFDYVATYMYEGDTPNAERRAAALSLDRDLLRELLGQEELRDLIDAERAGARRGRPAVPVGADAGDGARRAARRAAPRRRPVARRGRGCACSTGSTPARCCDELRGERRATRIRVNGEERWIDAADAGLYRDALGCAPPGGLPAAFLEDVPDALSRLLVRFAATHGPFTTDDVRARYGIDASAALRELERDGVAGPRRAAARAGREREWCDPEVLRRLRRASLAVLRKEIEPAEQRELARFLPAWQGVDRHPASGAGSRSAARDAGCVAGAGRCPPTCGSATSSRAGSAPTRRRGWTSCAPAARWCGSAPARWGETRVGWRSTSARTWRCSAHRRTAASCRRLTRTRRCGRGWPPGRASSPTCSSTSICRPRRSRRRCGTWPGPGWPPTTRSRRCARRG